jgi:hypothetical protein
MLSRDQTKPRSKVASLGEAAAGANRGHHRGGGDRAHSGDSHEPRGSGIVVRDRFDLVRDVLELVVHMLPLAEEAFDESSQRG